MFAINGLIILTINICYVMFVLLNLF